MFVSVNELHLKGHQSLDLCLKKMIDATQAKPLKSSDTRSIKIVLNTPLLLNAFEIK